MRNRLGAFRPSVPAGPAIPNRVVIDAQWLHIDAAALPALLAHVLFAVATDSFHKAGSKYQARLSGLSITQSLNLKITQCLRPLSPAPDYSGKRAGNDSLGIPAFGLDRAAGSGAERPESEVGSRKWEVGFCSFFLPPTSNFLLPTVALFLSLSRSRDSGQQLPAPPCPDNRSRGIARASSGFRTTLPVFSCSSRTSIHHS